MRTLRCARIGGGVAKSFASFFTVFLAHFSYFYVFLLIKLKNIVTPPRLGRGLVLVLSMTLASIYKPTDGGAHNFPVQYKVVYLLLRIMEFQFIDLYNYIIIAPVLYNYYRTKTRIYCAQFAKYLRCLQCGRMWK